MMQQHGSAHADHSATGHPQRWFILGILCTCLVLIVAAVSSLNIAIPSIQESLGATQTELQWIVDSYALVFAGLLLPAGALGDRYGRKWMLLGAAAGVIAAMRPARRAARLDVLQAIAS